MHVKCKPSKMRCHCECTDPHVRHILEALHNINFNLKYKMLQLRTSHILCFDLNLNYKKTASCSFARSPETIWNTAMLYQHDVIYPKSVRYTKILSAIRKCGVFDHHKPEFRQSCVSDQTQGSQEMNDRIRGRPNPRSQF